MTELTNIAVLIDADNTQLSKNECLFYNANKIIGYLDEEE